MKKKSLLIIPILFASFSMTSCQKEKMNLTFGTYIAQTLFTLKELNSNELEDKLFNQKENLLLAVYQDEYSQDCLCWDTFENVIVNFINQYHEQVYIFNAYNQSKALESLNIKTYKESTPMLYVFNGEKTVASFSYNNNRDKAIFSDLTGEAMFTRLQDYVNKPKMYFVDDDYLEGNLSNGVVLFMRDACGDCKYVIPNTLIPYINTHVIHNEIWLFNLQPYYELQANNPEMSNRPYDYYKNKYKLTETASAEYGYSTGVVPTFHYYQEKILKDASVYFNDEIDQKTDGSYYIKNSFYSKERLTSIKYTKTVLKDMIINKEDIVVTKTGNAFWSQEKAAKYHDPLLKSFLDMYL